MTPTTDQRRSPDRRRQHRGGRRPTDIPGYAPLVFVIDPRPTGRDACEAILAKLRFAVAPFDSVEQAIKVINALRPDLVLVDNDHLETVQDALASDRDIPVVPIPDNDAQAVALIDAVRAALRVTPLAN